MGMGHLNPKIGKYSPEEPEPGAASKRNEPVCQWAPNNKGRSSSPSQLPSSEEKKHNKCWESLTFPGEFTGTAVTNKQRPFLQILTCPGVFGIAAAAFLTIWAKPFSLKCEFDLYLECYLFLKVIVTIKLPLWQFCIFFPNNFTLKYRVFP